MQGPVPICMTCQRCQFNIMAHLPLSEQFETIQNQARLELVAETHEYQQQPMTLMEIMPKEITQETYPLLMALRKVLCRISQR